MGVHVYVPLHMRLTLFFALVLGLALWTSGALTYQQAERRAYSDLDTTLKSRAASVRMGKDLFFSQAAPQGRMGARPLPSVDALGTGGVAIQVLDGELHLLATTSSDRIDPLATNLEHAGTSPVPWDREAIQRVLQRYRSDSAYDTGKPDDPAHSAYSTITYQGQHVRVFTLLNDQSGPGNIHIIQTARSEADIEQTLSDLRRLLIEGGALALLLALTDTWLLLWRVLASVRRMTRTAQIISSSQDLSKRVPGGTRPARDELAILATTFNQMLSSLEEVYQRQQRFVSDASHELRAPVTSIRCNLDLLAKAPDLPNEEVEAALHDTRAEAKRMSRLVNDLLALARMDETRKTAVSIPNGYRNIQWMGQLVDLDSVLLAVFRHYHLSQANDLDGEQRAYPQLALQHIMPAQVYGDADQLKQAVVALVDNALKYTPQEGYVWLSLAASAGQALVKVSDTGIGITAEDQPHIFERFYRAHRARTRDSGSSGLGLAIVQGIMREHGGSVEVESTPGQGSVFTLRLPLAQNDEDVHV